MEVTDYFRRNVLENPERVGITQEMCERVVENPHDSEQQPNRRWVFWGQPEGRELYLRVIVTEDRTALLNAYFDTNYTRKQRRREREG